MKLYRQIGSLAEAALWDGSNEAEVRTVLGDDRPFPPLGYWVVRRSGGIAIYSPDDFSANYQPVL